MCLPKGAAAESACQKLREKEHGKEEKEVGDEHRERTISTKRVVEKKNYKRCRINSRMKSSSHQLTVVHGVRRNVVCVPRVGYIIHAVRAVVGTSLTGRLRG